MKLTVFSKKKEEEGMVLVGALAVMIFAALFSSIAISLVSTSAGSHYHLLEGTQALALANAGAEWYMKQLENDTDWTDEGTQTKSFAEGAFTINVSQATSGRVVFTSTGAIPSSLAGVTIRRRETFTVLKLPSAFLFALYQGRDPGLNLRLVNQGANPTVISGDVWSRGSVWIKARNIVQNGKVYVPDSESVSGAGSYTAKLVTPPYLTMPGIDKSYYTGLMAAYDALLNANNSKKSRIVNSGTFNLNTDPDCSGGICNFRNFTTRGTVTITGSGTIVVDRNLNLHSVSGSNSLTITPSAGGSIAFIANRNVVVGRYTDPVITNSGRVTFYSRSQSGNRQVLIQGAQTTLSGVTVLARYRIRVRTGADLTDDSILFVDHKGTAGNYLDIIGDTSDVTSVDGSLLSVVRRNPALMIRNGGRNKKGVVITGLVYAYGSSTTGYCYLDQATIQGSVVCNRYTFNRIRNVAITSDPGSLPATPPPGFDGFIMKEENSWDGL